MGICIFGQGDCLTKTSTDISDITNNDTTINNSIKNLIDQNCNTDTLQSNTINIIGSNVKKLSATQKNSIESMCILQTILKSNVSTEVVNNLLNKLKNNVETSGALLGSPASNDTIIKKMTTNKVNIDNSKFNQVSKNCILGAKQNNLLNIIGSNVEDTTTDQANKAFLKCLSQHSDDTGITAASLSDTKNETDNTTKTQGGDVAKSVGEGVSTAAQGVGTGVGTAAQGVGTGVSTAAQGVGTGVSTAAQGVGTGVGNALGGALGGAFIVPCIILLVISAIVAFIMFGKH
jgi:hypothetical protein